MTQLTDVINNELKAIKRQIERNIEKYQEEQSLLQQKGRYEDAEFYEVLIDGALEELAEYRSYDLGEKACSHLKY